jgi:thiol-disulfide isomerase/thioredoxin
MAPAAVSAQGQYAASDLLKLRPILKGVEYDTPTGQAVDACKVEVAYDEHKKPIGWALRDGQGRMLRRFVDTKGDPKMDQWSYYQDGFEVYRENDLNDDKSPDECRWLNTGGTRVASVKGAKVTAWKRISAEEASKVLVQAVVTGDLDLLETVMARPQELEAVGAPKAEVERLTDAAARRAEQVGALQKTVVGLGWNKQTVWNRLDGMMPHLIPADPGSGLSQDLVLYENAVIFAGPPIGQAPAGKLAFLQAPEMVKVGDVWKFIELPRAVDPEKPVIAAEGGLRAALMRDQGEHAVAAVAADVDAALKALQQYVAENANLLETGKKEDLARYHVGIVAKLNDVLKVVKTREERLTYNKQIIDSLVAAYQTGFFPKARQILEGLMNPSAKAVDGDKVASYAAFRQVFAEFALRNENNPGEILANQKKFMTELKDYIAKYPNAEEKPEALFQLAQGHEFFAEEDEARKYYTQLKDESPDTVPGKKATGALRRLDLVGKPLDLKATGVDKELVDTAKYKGKALLVVFWASWAEPVKRDLPELMKIYEKNKDRGFEVVGVNLDNERGDFEAFLKANKLPWPEVFEEGGMESPVAVSYGIISLPTMFLVDPEGRVANRSIRSAAEAEKQLDKVLEAKQGGVAFGQGR